MIIRIILVAIFVVSALVAMPQIASAVAINMKLSSKSPGEPPAILVESPYSIKVEHSGFEENRFIAKFSSCSFTKAQFAEVLSSAVFTLFANGVKVKDNSDIWPGGVMEPFIQWYALKKESEELSASSKKRCLVFMLKARRFTVEKALGIEPKT